MNLCATSIDMARRALRASRSSSRVPENNQNGRGRKEKVKTPRVRQYVIIGPNESFVKAVVKEYLTKGKGALVHESELSQYPDFKICYGILLEVDARPRCEVLIKDIVECARIVGPKHGFHSPKSNLEEEKEEEVASCFLQTLKAYQLRIANKSEVDEVLKNYKRSNEDFKQAIQERKERLLGKKKRKEGDQKRGTRSQGKESDRERERDKSKNLRPKRQVLKKTQSGMVVVVNGGQQNVGKLPLPPSRRDIGINGGGPPFSTKPSINDENNTSMMFACPQPDGSNKEEISPSFVKGGEKIRCNSIINDHQEEEEEILNQKKDLEIYGLIISEKISGIRKLLEYLLITNGELFAYLVNNQCKIDRVIEFICKMNA